MPTSNVTAEHAEYIVGNSGAGVTGQDSNILVGMTVQTRSLPKVVATTYEASAGDFTSEYLETYNIEELKIKNPLQKNNAGIIVNMKINEINLGF